MSTTRVPRTRHYLVCPPRYFDVQYAINPWMHENTPVDHDRAQDQWNALIRSYREHGHTVDRAEPVPGLPDMVFAANCALTLDGRVFGSRFHAFQRRAESTAYERWFKEAGYDVHRPESVCEGEGDLVPVGRRILAGWGFRTTRQAHDEVQEHFGVPTIGLRLVDPRFYHLDTALFALDDENIAYYPPAFSPGSREVLRTLYPQALLASDQDALVLGLNAVSDGRHVFVDARAAGLIEGLAERGYVPVPLDLSELNKAGGGIKCCTQEIRA